MTRDGLPALLRQFATFFGVGIGAFGTHYATMLGLVELGGWRPVPATLVGYVTGGVISYGLNRWLTYETARSHGEAIWRFTVVAFIGFLLTWGLMHLFVERLGLDYRPMQLVTTGIVLFWSFGAHKVWTFGEKPNV